MVSAGFEPKRLTAGFGASELGFEANNPPPDGASAFFLSSVGAGIDPLGFDPNKPADPNPGFGNPGFSFSVSTGAALKLSPPPESGVPMAFALFDRLLVVYMMLWGSNNVCQCFQ